ncbi:MAG: GspH/FimT family pseudopilin [Rhodocyclaceae bacterium]|jgi:type IV fimbrial biogenesis protein FimT|nr:GspH/FimT family pseudopilin [Rhodocyclaceae bacterium]
MIGNPHPRHSMPSFVYGFTLVELLITIAIVAILLGYGVPSLSGFIADQRVRTAVADIYHDLIFARADALGNTRQVIIEQRIANDWKEGWTICVDNTPRNGQCDLPAEEILKITQPLPGERLRVCTNVADFAQRIVFRPDGRIVRNTPVTDLDQITVSDDLGDGDTSNDKIRSIFFGASGRMTTMDQNGGANGGAACP